MYIIPKKYFDGHWNFGGVRQDGHIAMFPEELPKRLIKMFSFVSDTVLDPFLGSGTTSLAARNLNRNSVGYEMNPEFIPFIERKLEIHQSDIFNSDYEFIKQENIKIDYKTDIKKLPYIFKDFHSFDKKIDPKKLQFGSFEDLTLQDCKDYIYEVTVIRTYDDFLLEKSIINDGLAKSFPDVKFKESDPELDHAGDIDYIGKVKDKAFGIQIKPITASANFGNYSII